VDSARTSLDEAEAALGGLGDAVLATAVQLLRAFLDLAQARRADQAGDARRAAALRKAAIARRASALEPAAKGDRPLTARSAETRILVRILGAALGAEPGAEPGACGPPLLVESEGRWFQPPNGERVDCHRRPAMRGLLLAFVRTRLATPGQVLEIDDLLAAGWPGERILPDAAKNRLYVTLARLRKLGLEQALVAQGGGWLLDPATPVRLVPAL
jgi:hypothetical protein